MCYLSLVEDSKPDVFSGGHPSRRRVPHGERVDVVGVAVPEDDLAVHRLLVRDPEHEDAVVVGARQELGAAHDSQVWKDQVDLIRIVVNGIDIELVGLS